MAAVVTDTTKTVGDFLTGFTQTYIMEMVNMKIEGAIEDALEELKPAKLVAEEDVNEEKTLEEASEEGTPALAAGVQLVGQKFAIGPDQVRHHYYDLAVFAIKAQDSVVDRVTFRHSQMHGFAKALRKKVGAANIAAFPGTKWRGKDAAFYKARAKGIMDWLESTSLVAAARTHEDFLKFFSLQFDAAKAERLELFFSALEEQCSKEGINWEYAMRAAQRIGLDMVEVEMLKVVAIQKVGKQAHADIHSAVYSGTVSGKMPAFMKSRSISKLDAKIAAAVGTTVETGWTAAEPAFAEATKTLSEAMDSAVDPIKALLVKALTPIKELVDEKLGGGDAEEESSDEKQPDMDERIQALKADRFPPVAAMLASLKGGEDATAAGSAMRSALYDLNHTWKYTPYLQYDCGDAKVLAWFPPIAKIAEKHQRLTVAMVDTSFVLGRGLMRAFQPLLKYADAAKAEFDLETHDAKVKEALQIGGAKLALDYFHLPNNLWRATWYCGKKVTRDVRRFARITVQKSADLLGSVAGEWKPTSADDVIPTLGAALEKALDAFVAERTFAMCSLVRGTVIAMIADVFNEVAGDAIGAIAGTLDELISVLPPPLKDLKPGDIVTGMLEGLVETAAEKVVLKWAKKAELLLVDASAAVTPWDEDLASRFRCAPRVIESDEDLTVPAEDSGAEEEADDEKKEEDAPAEDAPAEVTPEDAKVEDAPAKTEEAPAKTEEAPAEETPAEDAPAKVEDAPAKVEEVPAKAEDAAVEEVAAE